MNEERREDIQDAARVIAFVGLVLFSSLAIGVSFGFFWFTIAVTLWCLFVLILAAVT